MAHAVKTLSRAVLKKWPLPPLGAAVDKDGRGQVLIVGGCKETPGAVLLSALAALRAGAGKLAIAVPASIALPLALRIPEARVIPLTPSRAGGTHATAWKQLEPLASRVSVLVLGPGLPQDRASTQFALAMIEAFREVPIVLDAGALRALRGQSRLAQPILITPHAGEMADLLDKSKQSIEEAPQQTAERAAQRWGVTVALKGSTTWIAGATGSLKFVGNAPGLATSGSGDVLSGIVAGMIARGLSTEHATAWAIFIHHATGAILQRRFGEVGYLASDLLPEIPKVIHRLSA
ncbi:MAG: hypothetical protein JWN73_2665 [Betaproteobacteria bacterium]|nr:hypothetical protein [Betaproteobacteria bacterium]